MAVTNEEMFEKLDVFLEKGSGILTSCETVSREIKATITGDHDVLIALGTKVDYIEEVAHRWNENHVELEKLKQRVSLLSRAGGVLSITFLANIAERLYSFLSNNVIVK